MRSFRILMGIMMFVLAVSLCVGSNASAQGQGQGGLLALQAEIEALQRQIDDVYFVCGTDQVEDADGNLYDTVRIGSQCWMAENLNVGTMVLGTTEQTDNDEIEKYCYNNDLNNCVTDGGLYQWNEMMQYSTTGGAQGICPTGWHLPTDWEWKVLEMGLGMTQAQADFSNGWRGTDQGTQLKQGGTSGFQALFAGLRDPNGSFVNRGTHAWFWSSTESGSLAWVRFLFSGLPSVNRSIGNKAHGGSVRCVKD